MKQNFNEIKYLYLLAAVLSLAAVIIWSSFVLTSEMSDVTSQDDRVDYGSTYSNHLDDINPPKTYDYTPAKAVDLSEEEIDTLYRLVYCEGGIESDECQKAICSVVLNRMTMRNQTFEEVIYAPNQFTVVPLLDNCTPSSRVIKNVDYVICHGPTIPEYVCYFRANHYFEWGPKYENYACFDRTYFSYSVADRDKIVIVDEQTVNTEGVDKDAVTGDIQ